MNRGLIPYILFNLLGIGCLVSILLLGCGPSETAFAGLTCGACVSCLGMGSILAFTEIKSRRRRKSPQTRPVEDLGYEPWYWQRMD